MKSKKRNVLGIGSLIRQKEVQQLIFFLGRYIVFLVAVLISCAFVITILTIFQPAALSRFRQIWLSTLLLLCGRFPEENMNQGSVFIGNLTIFIIGKLVIWGIFLPWALTRFIPHLNPIHFSGAVVINESDRCKETGKMNYKLVFRYWIMKRAGDFMYDVHLSACLQDRNEVYSEESGDPLFEWKTVLDKARGIRQWSCDISEAIENAAIKTGGVKREIMTPELFLEKLYHPISYSKKDDSRYRIVFYIRGTDSAGHTFSGIKSYKLSKVFYGARFARIRESEWNECIEKKNEMMKYQNFNKIVGEKDILRPDGSVYINSYQEEEDLEVRYIDEQKETEKDILCVRIVNGICKLYYNSHRMADFFRHHMAERRKIDIS